MSSGLPTLVLSIHSTPDLTFGLFQSIGVSIAPGRTALTRMFFAAPSSEDVRVNETSADLAAAYGATSGLVSMAWTLEMLTIDPPFFILRNACFVKKKAPNRST